MNDSTPSTTETPPDPRQKPKSTLSAFVHSRGRAEICTLYPPTVVAPHQTDAWIRATDDSFRSLEEWR